MAASELMESKASCESAIAVVQAEAADGEVFDKTGKVSTRGAV
jgi:uncharacterized protein YegP (UPF0339 family)